MKTYKHLLLLLSVILVGSCGSKMDNSYENVGQMLSYAQTNITKVTVNELKKILDHQGEYKIIDCREVGEYTEGHIPRAINIPRGILEFSNKISNRREAIYVYSQTNNRASLACLSLKLLKYNKVYLIDGGWEGWYEIFPEFVEKGDGGQGSKPAPKAEESSGCGG